MCPEGIAEEVKSALTGQQKVSHFKNIENLGQKIIYNYNLCILTIK